MRIEDVAPHLRGLLKPVAGKPNAKAMVAPPTLRGLPSGTLGSSGLLTAATSALGQLQGDIAHWPDADLLTRTLARREAVQSSQIEGTKAGLRDVLAYEVTLSADGKPPDVTVTERYVEALQLGLEEVRAGGRQALTLQLVHRMHAILMQDTPGALHGQYRTTQAWIGSSPRIEDATFVPTPPDDIQACMSELEQSMLQYAPREDEQCTLGVILQMAIAHAQFETIHPYADGNGRTGRLLMPLILSAEGLPPLYLSGSILRHREGYYAALRQVQLQGNWSAWMDTLCRAVVESANEAMAIARDVTSLVQSWEERTARFRSDSVARRLPPLLVGYPIVDAKRVAQLLNVSDPAARTGIESLVEAGILTAPGDRRWRRTWHAMEVLDRLDQPPGGG
ncbi:MAG: Fic family protein [Pseudomonadota bacterium]|nr:Fic family protein [Pseudomonadota bacterium]